MSFLFIYFLKIFFLVFVNSSQALCIRPPYFNPIQDGLFGAAHGWGRQKIPLPKISDTMNILQWSNLEWLYFTQRRSKIYVNHVTHLLSSACIIIFLLEISKFCYIKKYRYRLHFEIQFLFNLTFLESL